MSHHARGFPSSRNLSIEFIIRTILPSNIDICSHGLDVIRNAMQRPRSQNVISLSLQCRNSSMEQVDKQQSAMLS